MGKRLLARMAAGFLALIAICLLSGCTEQTLHGQGANQSLVEIGELSLEHAESLEEQDRIADANVEYRKALWAFRYHEKLTGEQPFLLDDALEGAKRTASEGGPR